MLGGTSEGSGVMKDWMPKNPYEEYTMEELSMVTQNFDKASKALGLAVNGDHRLPPRREEPSSVQHGGRHG